MKVLAISYGKNLFSKDHPEQIRQLACASVVDEYHVIVFSRSSEGLQSLRIGNLFLHPSGGRTRIGMVVQACVLGSRIVRHSKRSSDFVITAQDPFEAGLVGYMIARRNTLPLNVQEHGDFFSTSHWRQESYMNALRAKLGKWLLRQADTVRVVSLRMLATMQRIGVPATKLRVLSVEVPLQRFLLASPSDVARKLFPADSCIILTVARLVPQKNLSLLIRSFAALVAKNPQARLLIIGTGPEQEKLVALATALGLMRVGYPKVKFLPWTDDVPSYMKSSDIYALSSNYEGYARVIPEAMAAGVPVVATDVGCVGEVMLHGQNGIVVPVGGEAGFSEALVRLVGNPALRAEYGQTGQVAMTATIATQNETYAERWKAALV
jgi:glycosyltransferase involved in cell wall biosynthesis